MAHIDTWARHIRNLEEYLEIPPDLRALYEADAGGSYRPEIYLIYCPQSERARKPLTEKLIYVLNSSLFYIERRKSDIWRTRFDAGHLRVLETGYILLDSWMIIAGLGLSGQEMITVHYNRVVAPFFEKLVERLRLLALQLEPHPGFDNSLSLSLQKTSYKYMNYTRNIIFNGESQTRHVLQKMITGKRFKIIRVALTNDHIMILAKRELIQITEGRGMADRYGRINTFFIRKFIDRAEYSEDEQTGRLRAAVSSGLYKRNSLFSEKNKQDATALLARA